MLNIVDDLAHDISPLIKVFGHTQHSHSSHFTRGSDDQMFRLGYIGLPEHLLIATTAYSHDPQTEACVYIFLMAR